MTAPLEIRRGTGCIRVGVRTAQLPMTPQEKMDLCHELGMSIVEPMFGDREFPDLDAAQTFRKVAEDAGVEITSVGFFTNFVDPAQQAQFEQDCAEVYTVATALGVDYIFTLSSTPPEGIPCRDSWNLCRDRLRAFADGAAKHGLRIALEPEWYLGTGERVAKMIRDVDHPSFQHVNYDPTNFFTHGSDPIDCFNDLQDRIINGHIKDGFYRTKQTGEAPIGQGEVPWPEIVELMLSTGKTYTMHMEHCKTTDQVRNGAAYIQSVFKKLQG